LAKNKWFDKPFERVLYRRLGIQRDGKGGQVGIASEHR